MAESKAGFQTVKCDQSGKRMFSYCQRTIRQAPVSANRVRAGPLSALPERKTVRKLLTTVRSRVECHLREVALLGGTGNGKC
jgi:hypothetical protein